jgi:hypothetical protein
MAARTPRKREASTPEPEPEPVEIENDSPETIECVVKMNHMVIERSIIPTQAERDTIYNKGDIVVVPKEFFDAHTDSLMIRMEPSRQTEVETLRAKIALQEAELQKLKAGYE